MANKQIIEYITPPLADTDSLLKQSIGGLTGRASIGNLKDHLAETFVSKGIPIWDSETGNSTAGPLNLTLNHIYAFVVTALADNTDHTKQIIYSVFDHTSTSLPRSFCVYYDSTGIQFGYILASELTINCVAIGLDGEAAPSNNFKIFKIIDLGEISFDEVTE